MNNLKKIEESYKTSLEKIQYILNHSNEEISEFAKYLCNTNIKADSFLSKEFHNIFDTPENLSNFLIFFETNFLKKNVFFIIVNGEPKIIFKSLTKNTFIKIIVEEFEYPDEKSLEKVIFLQNCYQFIEEHSSFILNQNRKLFLHQAHIYGLEQAKLDFNNIFEEEWVIEFESNSIN